MDITCSHCQAINRVPAERAHDGAICAKCKTPLLPDEPLDLDGDVLDAVLANTRGVPVVVDFWAPWCGPCQVMAPLYHEAAIALHGEAILTKLDTEANQVAAARHGIRSIPTVAIFLDGREIARSTGARPAAEIVRWVRAQR